MKQKITQRTWRVACCSGRAVRSVRSAPPGDACVDSPPMFHVVLPSTQSLSSASEPRVHDDG